MLLRGKCRLTTQSTEHTQEQEAPGRHAGQEAPQRPLHPGRGEKGWVSGSRHLIKAFSPGSFSQFAVILQPCGPPRCSPTLGTTTRASITRASSGLLTVLLRGSVEDLGFSGLQSRDCATSGQSRTLRGPERPLAEAETKAHTGEASSFIQGTLVLWFWVHQKVHFSQLSKAWGANPQAWTASRQSMNYFQVKPEADRCPEISVHTHTHLPCMHAPTQAHTRTLL